MPTNEFDIVKRLTTDNDMAKANAEKLLADYGAPFEEAGKLLASYQNIVVTDENDTEAMARAGATRKQLKAIRIGIEKRHDELKADSLKYGRAVDLVQRVAVDAIKPAEQYLQLQEDYAETQRELRRQARATERRTKLSEFVEDTSVYNFVDMGDDAFTMLLDTVKHDKERREQEAADQIAKDKALAEQLEKDRVEKEAKERTARLAAEKKAKAEKLAREAAEAELQVARAEQQKLAQAEADRVAAETAERVRRENEQRAAEAAPDKEKLLTVVDNLITGIDIPSLATDAAKLVQTRISTHLKDSVTQYRALIEKEL